jgi:hypothetical protein
MVLALVHGLQVPEEASLKRGSNGYKQLEREVIHMAMRTVERQQTVVPNASKFRDTAFWAYWVLRLAFFALSVELGAEKIFTGTVQWPRYFWSGWPHLLGTTPIRFVHGVGVLEVVVGIVVLVAPRLGSLALTAWFGVVVANIGSFSVTHSRYWDLTVRDACLLAGVIGLFLLAWAYRPLRYVVHEHGHAKGTRTTQPGHLNRAA